MEGPDEEAVAARAELGRIIHERMGQGADGIIFDDRHDDSPIVIGDGTPPPPADPARYHPSARPGHRAPHLWLGEGDPLSDHFGLWFTLLDLGADRSSVAAVTDALTGAGVPFTLLEVRDPAVREAYGEPLVLIRPDRIVAWRGAEAPADPRGLVDTIRGAARAWAGASRLAGGRAA